MVKPWDKKMKQLFSEASQDYVTWLLPDAQFNGIVSTELEAETVYADILLDVTLDGERMLLHVENQRARDANMAERLWTYNKRTTIKYQRPVWSVVIYLKDDGSVAETPLLWAMRAGRQIHRFDFSVVKLWEIATEELWQMDLPGLLPLLPLTQDGARRGIIEHVIERLAPPGQEPMSELLALAYGLASLTLKDESDQTWLVRRFSQMYDMLHETRAYQELIREGVEKGLEQGLAQGLEQGRQQGLQRGLEKGLEQGLSQGLSQGLEQGRLESAREILNDVSLELFPEIMQTVKGPVSGIKEVSVLRHLAVKVSTVQTAEEVLRYIRALTEQSE